MSLVRRAVAALLVLGVTACADPSAIAAGRARPAIPDFVSHARFETAVVVSLVAIGVRRAGAAAPRGVDTDDFDADDAIDDGTAPPWHSDADLERSLASGIVVSADGLIVTTAHAVAGLDDITVQLADRRQFAARVLGLDETSDVAVLKIDAHDLGVARIGDPAALAVGAWVAAIGAPFGLDRTLTAGIVSAVPRYFPDFGGLPLIQTDVALNRGNSGGPLFNLDGEVVGMNALMMTDTGASAGVSFALPIDAVLAIADELLRSGRVRRSQLGARFQDLTSELAASFGMAEPRGALITQVDEGSAAQRAGLQRGDIIAAIDGTHGLQAPEIQQRIARSEPGRVVSLQVWRGGRWLVLHVPVEAIEARPTVAAAKRVAEPAPRLGLLLLEVQDAQRHDGAVGLWVQSAAGAARHAGIRPDDRILAVNDTPVARIAEFDAALYARDAARPLALLVQRGRALNYVLVRGAPAPAVAPR